MKIAVNTRFLLKDKLEGLGLYKHEVLKRMVANHPSDTFYFIFDRAFDPSYIYANNVKGIILNPPTRHPVLWWIWFEMTLPKVLKKINPDVFLTMDGFNSLQSKVPSVLVIHDLAFLHYGQFVPKLVAKFYRRYTPKYIDKASHLICVSNATADDVIKNYGTDKDKISIAYNGVRKEFQPLNKHEIEIIQNKYTEGESYFLFVGAIHPRKNVIMMIHAFDAFKELSGSNFKFVIVGRRAWHNQEMEKAFESAKYKSDIIFTGYLDLIELANITASAFALLYISLFEGFGVPMIEAMNCNVPIIASNCSSMPEVIGEAGIVVDPNNLNEIVGAMSKLYDNPHIIKDLINKEKTQRLKFNWDDTAHIIYDCLKSQR